MRGAALLSVVVLAAGCGGDEPERELPEGTLRIGVVSAERLVFEGARVAVNRIDNAGGIGGRLAVELVRAPVGDLLTRDLRLIVLPCREGLVDAARRVEEAGALAVAPCDDGVLGPDRRRVFATGLSPRAQAAALAAHVDGEAEVLEAQTQRGRRVEALLDFAAGGDVVVSPDAPERVHPPDGARAGTLYATYGFPDPGNRTDEFYERFRAVFGRRPETILAALAGDALEVLAKAIEEAASTDPDLVAAAFGEGFRVRGALGDIDVEDGRSAVTVAIVRVESGRLRLVATR